MEKNLKDEIIEWKQSRFNKNKEILVTYWGGYFNSPNQTLDKIPDGIDIVNLAFCNPINNKLNPRFLCSVYSEKIIKGWVKKVQSRGIKVMASIIDESSCFWDQVDMKIFIPSVLEFVNQWGLDGIDIDGESGATPISSRVKSFIELANLIRNILPDDKILTYTCYLGMNSQDGSILKGIYKSIDWINTMAYFYDFEGMTELYNDYRTLMGDKITIGVKAGKEFTDLDEVKKLTLWKPKNGQKLGMMLWTLNRDNPNFTGQPEWTWTKTILENLLQVKEKQD